MSTHHGQRQEPGLGKLTVTIGPMCAGKSTEAKRQFDRHRIANRSCLLIKHQSDDERLSEEEQRLSKTELSSSGQQIKRSAVYLHSSGDGVTLPEKTNQAISVAFLKDVPPEMIEAHEYLFVDEGQWFPDLVTKVTEWVREKNKRVYVYGLDSDHRGRPMINILTLSTRAHHTHSLRAVCMKCHRGNASMTIKRGISLTEGIQVGGKETYEARCLNCLPDDFQFTNQEVFLVRDDALGPAVTDFC